jgi:Icc protein
MTAGPVLASLARPRTPRQVRIAVIADPHVTVDERGTWKVFHRTRDRLATAVADANARGVEFVLLAGDLTGNGRPEEFAAVSSVLADLDSPWAAIPGNHDVPKSFDAHDGVGVESFADRFAPGLPFVVEVGPVTLFGVNSASAPGGRLRETWGGRVSEDQLAWLNDRLTDAATPVVACHHNLAPLPENPGG